jgi:hypothetical protein
MNDLKKKDLLVSPTRRSLMSYALKGGVAAGFANMTIMLKLRGALPRGAIGMIFVPKKQLI